MFKCKKDPKNKKWHKSIKEAIACGCHVPKEKKTTEKIEKIIEKIVKNDDDKTAGKEPVTTPSEADNGLLSASPAESEKPKQEPEQQPELEKKKNWVLEICVAVVAILLAAFWVLHYFLMPLKTENEDEKNE